jgi:hypothetical protein
LNGFIRLTQKLVGYSFNPLISRCKRHAQERRRALA